MNISSVIVKTRPQDCAQVVRDLQVLEHVEVPVFDTSKGIAIAVIEAPSVREEIVANRRIEAVAGVMSAHMHYSYSEDSPQVLGIAETIEKIESEDADYSGDVRHWL